MVYKTYPFRKWRRCSLLCTYNGRSQLCYYMYRRSYTEMSNIRRCLLIEWSISEPSFSTKATYVIVMTQPPSTLLYSPSTQLLTVISNLFVCINASTILLYIKYCNARSVSIASSVVLLLQFKRYSFHARIINSFGPVCRTST